MSASLWPIVITFLFLLIVSRVMPKPSNPSDGESSAETASTELVTVDHALYNKQNIENYTFHGKAMDYIEYEGTGFRATETSFSVDVRKPRTKPDEVGTTQTCEEVLEEQGENGRLRTFRCENAASFYKWEALVSSIYYFLLNYISRFPDQVPLGHLRLYVGLVLVCAVARGRCVLHLFLTVVVLKEALTPALSPDLFFGGGCMRRT